MAEARAAERDDPRLLTNLVAVAAFMVSLDAFILTISFPHLAEESGNTPSAVSCVGHADLIAHVSTLILFGALADRHGFRRICLAGSGVITIARAPPSAAVPASLPAGSGREGPGIAREVLLDPLSILTHPRPRRGWRSRNDAGGVRHADVAVLDGRFTDVGTMTGPSRCVVNASGRHVLRDGVESHLPVENDPFGQPTTDDFFTQSIAPAHDGVTNFFDFANTVFGGSVRAAIAAVAVRRRSPRSTSRPTAA